MSEEATKEFIEEVFSQQTKESSMEDKAIADGKIGAEGEYKVDFSDGRLRIEASYTGKGLRAGSFVEGDAVYLVDKITDAIPGEWDDELLDGLAEKILSKKSG